MNTLLRTLSKRAGSAVETVPSETADPRGRLFSAFPGFAPFRIVDTEEGLLWMEASLAGATTIAWDTETTGTHPVDDVPILVGVCGTPCAEVVEGKPVVYLVPLGFRKLLGGDQNCPRDAAVETLRAIFGDPQKVYRSHNAKFDLHQMANIGVEVLGTVEDSLFSCFLGKRSDRELIGLKEQVPLRLKLPMLPYNQVFGVPSTVMDRLQDEDMVQVSLYCAMDTYGHLLLGDSIKTALQATKRPGTDKTLWSLAQVGVRFMRVLWRMERLGFVVDPVLVQEKLDKADEDLLECEKQIYVLASEAGPKYSSPDTFNVSSGPQLNELVKALGYEKHLPATDVWRCVKMIEVQTQLKTKVRTDFKRCKGKVSGRKRAWQKGDRTATCPECGSKIPPVRATDKNAMEILDDAGVPIAAELMRHKKISKMISGFLKPLLVRVSKKTGRVHTTFNQTGARTSRLSSSDPNLQQIPSADKDAVERGGYALRDAFVAPDGRLLIVADYSQLELRLCAHLSGDPTMIAAFLSGVDFHAATAARMFGVPLDKMVRLLKEAKQIAKDHGHPSEEHLQAVKARSIGKTINFGVLYGMGPQKLARQAGLTLAEAEHYLGLWFKTYPGVEALKYRCQDEAMRTGYATTLLGFKRPLAPLIHSQSKEHVAAAYRQCFNTRIQGTAANVAMMAMIRLDDRRRAGGMRSDLLLQIHDEFVFSVEPQYAEAEVPIIKEIMERPFKEPLRVPLEVDPVVGFSWGECKRQG